MEGSGEVRWPRSQDEAARVGVHLFCLHAAKE